MSVLSHSDTELGPSLGSLLSPIKSPKAAKPRSCQPGSVAELGLRDGDMPQCRKKNEVAHLCHLIFTQSQCSSAVADDDQVTEGSVLKAGKG